jgi:hypothetical protein
MSDSENSVYDWPDSVSASKKLANLEQDLCCPICQGFLNNPHILKCGHTYCSICIRQHFDPTLNRTSSDICPTCREKADSFDLRKNSAMAAVVQGFRSVRKELLKLIEASKTSAQNNFDDVQFVSEDLHGRRSSSSCQNSVGTNLPTGNAEGVQIVKRIPHYSFHGATKDKVRKVVDQLTSTSAAKLRSDGDKDALEKRLRKFIHLHNAQIGSDRPLTLEAVVRLVNAEEGHVEKEAFKNSRMQKKLEKVKSGEVVCCICNCVGVLRGVVRSFICAGADIAVVISRLI